MKTEEIILILVIVLLFIISILASYYIYNKYYKSTGITTTTEYPTTTSTTAYPTTTSTTAYPTTTSTTAYSTTTSTTMMPTTTSTTAYPTTTSTPYPATTSTTAYPTTTSTPGQPEVYLAAGNPPTNSNGSINYIFTGAQAQQLAYQLGGQLATPVQLTSAYNAGADWCNTGRLSDTTCAFPINTSIKNGCALSPQIITNTGWTYCSVTIYGVKPSQNNNIGTLSGTTLQYQILPFNASKWSQYS